MKKINISTSITELESVSELSNEQQELVQSAIEAAKGSYSPYSEFKVGAALKLGNGKTIKGNNQENAAYPSGLCAERVAIFYAGANYPDQPVLSIALVGIGKNGITSSPTYPCGACRQVMLETENRFNVKMKIIMVAEDRVHIAESAASLLPMGFLGTAID